MNIEKMKEMARLYKELQDEGVYGFYDGKFQVNASALKDEPNLQIETRNTSDYPYEIFLQHEDVIVFAIIQTEQVKDFPQFKEQAKEVLRKQLAYLEEDVDLSGMKEVI